MLKLHDTWPPDSVKSPLYLRRCHMHVHSHVHVQMQLQMQTHMHMRMRSAVDTNEAGKSVDTETERVGPTAR